MIDSVWITSHKLNIVATQNVPPTDILTHCKYNNKMKITITDEDEIIALFDGMQFSSKDPPPSHPSNKGVSSSALSNNTSHPHPSNNCDDTRYKKWGRYSP